MDPQQNSGLETKPETNRRYEMVEMHLFDEDASEENALCGADTSDHTLRSAMCYLEDRLHCARVGVVCVRCKVRAIPFAVKATQDLEAEGLPDEAEEHRQLAETLMKETSQ